jgi:uncharacterized protein YcfL
MKKILLFCFVLFLIAGCKNEQTQVIFMNNSQDTIVFQKGSEMPTTIPPFSAIKFDSKENITFIDKIGGAE